MASVSWQVSTFYNFSWKQMEWMMYKYFWVNSTKSSVFINFNTSLENQCNSTSVVKKNILWRHLPIASYFEILHKKNVPIFNKPTLYHSQTPQTNKQMSRLYFCHQNHLDGHSSEFLTPNWMFMWLNINSHFHQEELMMSILL